MNKKEVLPTTEPISNRIQTPGAEAKTTPIKLHASYTSETKTRSIPRWGGQFTLNAEDTDKVITKTNTCPIDNMLYMLYTILKSRGDLRAGLQNSHEWAIQCLVEVVQLFAQGHTAQGKGLWLHKVAGFHEDELL